MMLQGTVKDGMVLVDDPKALPDGARVKIWVEAPAEAKGKPSLRERLLKLAGTVDDLPADMARNHDHYIHGAPRR